jgi:translation initiation factor IF-3
LTPSPGPLTNICVWVAGAGEKDGVCFFATGRRRNFIATPTPSSSRAPSGPRVNEQIDVPSVRLVDQNGEMIGVVPTRQALTMAEEAGLDLVEVAAQAVPPVCKILDYGKFKYAEQKRRAEARKRQKVTEVKEIKMRPNIDKNDYDVKMRNVVRFLREGDKVKVTMRFRGREMVHQEIGMNVLMRVRKDLEEVAKVEQMPQLEGRQMSMVMSPK